MHKNSIAIVIDDHELFSDSFVALLDRLKIFEHISSFTDDTELFKYLLKNEHSIIYIFLDYYLKDKTSLNLINDIRRIAKNARIVTVSSVTSPSLIKNILKQKPNGFISKMTSFETVLQCLKTIEKKEQFFDPLISEIIQNNNATEEALFSSRELELLQLFSKGLSIEEAATQSNLSRHTIIAHRRNMMAKANCKSITELLWYAREKGLI